MPIFYTTSPALDDAIANLSEETPVGSILREPDWATVPAELRHTAFFTAAVENASYLAEAQERILEYLKQARQQLSTDAIEGESITPHPKGPALATALREIADQLGARRDVPGNQRTPIGSPFAQRLRLSADSRIQSAQAYAKWKAGQYPDLLDAFPAQEMINFDNRSRPAAAWQTRWIEAGGKLYDGRMIARRDDPIWQSLSHTGGWESPMKLSGDITLEDVDRFTAEDLGVIDPDGDVEAIDRSFTADLHAEVQGIPPSFIRALKNLFGDQLEFDGDAVRWIEQAILANANPYHDRLGRFSHRPAGRGWPSDFLGRKPTREMSVDENIQRANKAIEHILRTRRPVRDAMLHPELGMIGLTYGLPGSPKADEKGTTHKDGYGVSHILAKHGRAALDRMPVVVMKGKVHPHPRDARKRIITHGSDIAVLGPRPNPKKGRQPWIITSLNDPKTVAALEGR